MRSHNADTILWSLVLVSLTLVLGCGGGPEGPGGNDDDGAGDVPEPEVFVTLDQGWSDDERIDFYRTSQGSQLLPYAWFLALEQPGSESPFRDDSNMTRLGYFPQAPVASNNPDGLPVGFVKDDVAESFLAEGLSTSRLPAADGDIHTEYREWLGLTCAACHTSGIRYDNQTLLIDGGPPLADFQGFMTDLADALAATADDTDKLERFARTVLAEGGYNETEQQRLKSELDAFLPWIRNYLEVNYSGLTTPYGYGRLDAFGAILNRVTSTFTGIESNAAPANAPVSYPFLWNTSHLDWVQWNGSAGNHIGRNVGEVSGVFAYTIVDTADDDERFSSSADIFNLDRLEQLMGTLESPPWGAPLPPIDEARAAAGESLFAESCVACHGIRDENGEFPMTDPNPAQRQFIKTLMVPLETIGTDPLMAINFVDPRLNVDPGIVRDYLPPAAQAAETVPRALMLSVVVEQVINKQLAAMSPPLDDQQMLTLTGGHVPGETPPNFQAYKARPLNGVWATAPFLHNGSVSSLYEMLLPDTERAASFYVGSRDFDPEKVGFVIDEGPHSSLLQTVDDQGNPIPGNRNSGHSGENYTAIRGSDGELRSYTDEERLQLIEYMKTL